LIRDDFDRIGYEIGTSDHPGESLVLNAEEFGVPQTRHRLFFLGYRRGAASPIAGVATLWGGAASMKRTGSRSVGRASRLAAPEANLPTCLWLSVQAHAQHENGGSYCAHLILPARRSRECRQHICQLDVPAPEGT
jgi:site-specific DNA-cytosine methylase